MVSHDRYLIRRLATSVWAIEGRELRVFREYEVYREWKEERQKVLVRQRERQRSQATQVLERNCERERCRVAQRETERRAKRGGELEDKIHDLEARQGDLEARIAAASAAQDVAEVRRLGEEYGEVEAELNAALTEWAEL
jgi:ATPase subunit of ABC transporter with duplicated ATPase domains